MGYMYKTKNPLKDVFFIIIFLLGMDRCKKSKSVLPRYDKAVIRYPI